MTHAPVPDVLRMLTAYVDDPEARWCLLRCADAIEGLREAIRNEPLRDDNFRREMCSALAQVDSFPVQYPRDRTRVEN